MAQRHSCNGIAKFGSLFAGALLTTMSISVAQAAVIRDTTVRDFKNAPVSFGFFGDLDFTLSNTGDSVFGSPVAVNTSGGGAVRTIFGSPSVDFDPPRNSGPYDSSLIYGSFSTPTPISYSGPPSLLGLSDTIGGKTYYGYAEFYQNTLVSYAYETTAGVGIVAPVPLPAAAPLFGAALLGLAGLGYAARRKTSLMG